MSLPLQPRKPLPYSPAMIYPSESKMRDLMRIHAPMRHFYVPEWRRRDCPGLELLH